MVIVSRFVQSGLVGLSSQELGGKIGKKYNFGRLLYELVPLEEVPGIVEGIMDFYREEGRKGERLIETIERIGWEALEKKLAKN